MSCDFILHYKYWTQSKPDGSAVTKFNMNVEIDHFEWFSVICHYLVLYLAWLPGQDQTIVTWLE